MIYEIRNANKFPKTVSIIFASLCVLQQIGAIILTV